MTRPRSGIALPAVLVVLLLLSVAASGAVRLALEQRQRALVDVELAGARIAAESGIRLATRVARDPGALGADDGDGGFVTGEVGARYPFEVRVDRLDAEHLLLEAEGRGGPEEVLRRRLGRVLWRMDPDRRLAGTPAVLAHGGEFLRTDSAEVLHDAFDAEDCDPLLERALEALEGQSPPRRLRLEEWWTGPAGEGPRASLGWWTGPALRSLADEVRPLSTGSDGETLPDSLPLLVATGPTPVTSGDHTGLLWGDGDLELGGTVVIRGPVLVDGGLRMRDSARIEGYVRVTGSVHLSGGARIQGSGCAFLRALESTPGLRDPAPIPVRSWLFLPPP